MLRTYPAGFARSWEKIVPHLQERSEGKPWPSPEILATLDAKALFASMSFTDMWNDGGLTDVALYLRGNRHLAIPPEWRPHLPSELPVFEGEVEL